MAKKIKKISLENLSVQMQRGFASVDKSILKSIEELAQMTARGFESVTTDVSGLKSDVVTLQNDVSDIKLRLDNLAPKFEVKDLEKRVRRLEVKAGIRQEV